MTAVAHQRREMFWQIVRYGVNGGIVTALYSAVLVVLDSWSHLPLQICNIAGYLAAVTLGYVLHSRVTFRNHGKRDRASKIRFVLASLPSLALNAFWAWLLTEALKLPHWTLYVPIWFVTPALLFVLNRWWVFR
ncbi:GtrA family protein [Sphingomonas sp.]|uniref:GtrA family protein n=1 Tax=Sphingomonas sp. TaxID=28214 RepID=UPI003B3BE508